MAKWESWTILEKCDLKAPNDFKNSISCIHLSPPTQLSLAVHLISDDRTLQVLIRSRTRSVLVSCVFFDLKNECRIQVPAMDPGLVSLSLLPNPLNLSLSLWIDPPLISTNNWGVLVAMTLVILGIVILLIRFYFGNDKRAQVYERMDECIEEIELIE